MSAGTSEWVLPLSAVGAGDLARVGGKGANLGVLVAAGLPVPPGFCVTTAAFDRFVAQDPALGERLDALDRLDPDDVEGVRTHAGQLREQLRGLPVPEEVREAVLGAWREAGAEHAYAVRSSATLEDLPQASFAGQQDTYLETRGAAAIEQRVRDCWASLFTDRAVLYRRQHGFPSRAARLAVVVQRMVAPEVSGILFTADPVTGHRGVCSIDASYGLGEALVSGLVDADLYRLEKATGAVLEARVGAKAQAIVPLPAGGTELRPVPAEDRARRCLSDAQLAELLALGQRVEEQQGCPQDLEWCIEDGTLWLVQARAITSLFPIPEPASADGGLRAYMSFGHVQVNTAPMPPMAHDVVRWLVPFGKDGPHARSSLVASAGGRIYLDMTPALLRWPLSRVLPAALMNIDPGIARRLTVVQGRAASWEGAPQRAARWRTLRWLLRRVGPALLGRLLGARPERAREEFGALVESAREGYVERFAGAQPGAPRLREASRALGEFFYGPVLPLQLPVVIGGMLCWGMLRRLVRGRVPDETVRALSRGLPGQRDDRHGSRAGGSGRSSAGGAGLGGAPARRRSGAGDRAGKGAAGGGGVPRGVGPLHGALRASRSRGDRRDHAALGRRSLELDHQPGGDPRRRAGGASTAAPGGGAGGRGGGGGDRGGGGQGAAGLAATAAGAGARAAGAGVPGAARARQVHRDDDAHAHAGGDRGGGEHGGGAGAARSGGRRVHAHARRADRGARGRGCGR